MFVNLWCLTKKKKSFAWFTLRWSFFLQKRVERSIPSIYTYYIWLCWVLFFFLSSSYHLQPVYSYEILKMASSRQLATQKESHLHSDLVEMPELKQAWIFTMPLAISRAGAQVQFAQNVVKKKNGGGRNSRFIDFILYKHVTSLCYIISLIE